MPVHLDHTIVPARDKESSAKWFAEIMGLEYRGPWGHFAPVKIDEHLSLDFDDADDFQPVHYAFIVSDGEFDAILGRVQRKGIVYGSGPRDSEDMQINHRHHGRGFYFKDPNGHLLEVITHTYE
ncbi:MAG TPA: VOC family protein [Chloroflexota bacterium]|nr:VOC family protein [Chloroflexota bacterium]